MSGDITFSVFTKPWKGLSVDELGKYIKDLGFDGIEFPLRPGFQLEPHKAEKGLPELARQLAVNGISITSVAGPAEENVFSGCAEAGIPVIRIMYEVDRQAGYLEQEKLMKKDIERIIPLCEKYGVKLGVQNHCDFYVCNSMGLMSLLQDYPQEHVGAVWDSAHNALNGEEPEMGLDIVWSHLLMVNLKNAFVRRKNGPEAEVAEWEHYYTSGKQGLASWKRIADYLKLREYKGVICLTAEYTAEKEVNRLIREDIAYAKSLFQG